MCEEQKGELQDLLSSLLSVANWVFEISISGVAEVNKSHCASVVGGLAFRLSLKKKKKDDEVQKVVCPPVPFFLCICKPWILGSTVKNQETLCCCRCRGEA